MGGGGKGKRKSDSKYSHVHTANPEARESDNRRAGRAAAMEVTRLERAVERQISGMRAFVPESLRKRPKIDPLYDLKGAARPAREHYVDPNYVPEPEPEDLLKTFAGRLWEHDEGQALCRLKWQLGVALHNVGNQQRKAVGIFSELLLDDPDDRMNARVSLLRCYFDSGDAANARAVLERFPDDVSVPFCFGRVLLECIAVMLEEEDASQALVVQAIEKANAANPYAIWVFAFYEIFESAIDFVDELSNPAIGSVEDAVLSAMDDIELWTSVDGALDALMEYINCRRLPYPELPLTSESSSAVATAGSADGGGQDTHDIYVGMYRTAIEMIEEERNSPDA